MVLFESEDTKNGNGCLPTMTSANSLTISESCDICFLGEWDEEIVRREKREENKKGKKCQKWDRGENGARDLEKMKSK